LKRTIILAAAFFAAQIVGVAAGTIKQDGAPGLQPKPSEPLA